MSKRKTPAVSIETYVENFGVVIGAAAVAIQKAGEIYSAAIDAHGDKAAEAFHKAYPAVTGATWDRLRLIGKGCAVPETLFLSDRISRRIEMLPIDEQREMLGGKTTLKVVTSKGAVVDKPLADLTAAEEDTLFTETGRKRTIAEQRRRWAERAQHKTSPAYEVRGNTLIVRRACRIGKDELTLILEGMK